jgi:sulfate adenylyltransferase subunit 1
VVDAHARLVRLHGPTLLELLERCPTPPPKPRCRPLPFRCSGSKSSRPSDTSQGRRVFWGRVATGRVRPASRAGLPSGQTATVAQVLDHARRPGRARRHSAGIVLDREVDVSRGDWLLAAPTADAATTLNPRAHHRQPGQRELTHHRGLDGRRAPGRRPRVLGAARPPLGQGQGARVVHRWTSTPWPKKTPPARPNAIGHVELLLQEPMPRCPIQQSRVLGALMLVDTATPQDLGRRAGELTCTSRTICENQRPCKIPWARSETQ